MRREERFQQILDLLGKEGFITVEGLSKRFYISLPTAYRDLRELERQRLVIRGDGGAMLVAPEKANLPVDYRVSVNAEAKTAIGKRAAELLEPVTALVETLEGLGGLDGGSVAILFKAVGVGLITDIAAMVCTDSGNASMAKAVGLLGTAAVLWLSLPLFEALLSLIQEILEGL